MNLTDNVVPEKGEPYFILLMLCLISLLPFAYELLYFSIVMLVNWHIKSAVYIGWKQWGVDQHRLLIANIDNRISTINTFAYQNVIVFTAVNLLGCGAGIGIALLFCWVYWLVSLAITVSTTVGILTGLWNSSKIVEYWSRAGRWRVLRRLRVVTVVLLVCGVAVSTAIILPVLSSQVEVIISLSLKWPRIAGTLNQILLIYMLVPIIHLLQASVGFRHWREVADGVYHLCNFMYGIVRFARISNDGAIDRLHHDILGLFLNLFPINAVRVIGTLYIIDSVIYETIPVRGYDFSNVVVDHIGLIVGTIIVNSCFQILNIVILSKVRSAKNERRRQNSSSETDSV